MKVWTRKRFGQNFLSDKGLAQSIVNCLGIEQGDYIVEIGPGRGALTGLLAERASRVWAIEIDRGLARDLANKLKGVDNLSIIEADALNFDFSGLASQAPNPLKAVGNLPYNISTQLLFKLLPRLELFSEFTFMLQKEVASRVVAEPGTKSYGAISLLTRIYSDSEIIMELGPEAFYPKPKVNSGLVRFKLLDQPRIGPAQIELFKKVVRAAFHHRRKTLINSVLTDAGLAITREAFREVCKSSGIDERIRAERLGFKEFERLTEEIAKIKTGTN